MSGRNDIQDLSFFLEYLRGEGQRPQAIMNYEASEIENLQTKSDNQLLAILGEQLVAGRFNLNEPTEDDLVDEGTEWWRAHLDELREMFCASGLLRQVHHASGEIRVQLITTIADAILKQWTLVPPLVITLLLVRYGQERLCGDETPA